MYKGTEQKDTQTQLFDNEFRPLSRLKKHSSLEQNTRSAMQENNKYSRITETNLQIHFQEL